MRNAFLAAALATLATPIASQLCIGPDNLTGGCWEPRDLNVPQFPPIDLPGLGVCWDKCKPTAQECIAVRLDLPGQNPCGQYSAQLRVDTCSGAPLLEGDAGLDYTRTWTEATPDGLLYQVWRFALKADLALIQAGAAPCPAPPCLFSHETAFFYGYVDYALRCDGTAFVFENALVLYHACDDFIHRPGLSDKPGVFHPDSTFGIVAPHTAANPFDPTVQMPATGGPLVAEAVRNVAPAGFKCIAEERIEGGNKVPLIRGCACPLSFDSLQQTAVKLTGVGSCVQPDGAPSSFATLNFWPTLPWFDMVTTSIGRWTTGASYPGSEHAYVDEGLFLYHDSCVVGGAGEADLLEVHYGGSTKGGYMVLPISPSGVPLTDRFTDLAANYTSNLTGPPPLPLVGSIRPTFHLIYVNTP